MTGPGTLPRWGARFDRGRQLLSFDVYSENATRIELWLFAEPRAGRPVAREPLTRRDGGRWSLELPATPLLSSASGALYYGYRAWGPNWPFDAAWTPGTERGFVSDVDAQGNRFNPNKLLLDPYALEISHDPAPRLSTIDPNEYVEDYYSGPGSRAIDSARAAPKSVLMLSPIDASTGYKPKRPLRDDVIYEAHVRGFTRADPAVPEQYRGTFRGAALKAEYLKGLGVTAIELLPVFQFASEQNDDGDPRGDNYWGYMTLGFFAPNRRYAADQSPGGPTREFRAMVKAFHDAGIKVFLDVVFNHTGEGLLRRASEGDDSRTSDERQLPDRACLLSFRGLDNATWYTLRSRPDLDHGQPNQRYQDNSACGPNLNVARPAVQALVIDSLRYWAVEQGVDGFRFDLAPVLGNRLDREGYEFSADGLLARILEALPVRSADGEIGVDLIAEPWAVGAGTYQLGRFPLGWAQWNDRYRQLVRRAENKLWVDTPLPYEVADALSGSDQQLRRAPNQPGARPWHSINYVSAHDGYTLRDVFSFNGGDQGWDHGGDAARQRKAVRNALALLLTSSGVPMFQGGDELYRTQGGVENAVALDTPDMYIDWADVTRRAQAIADQDAAAQERLRASPVLRCYDFTRALLSFRQRHSALRRDTYFTGERDPASGLRDITWYGSSGAEFDAWNDGRVRYLAFRVDAARDTASTGVRSIYVGYNWSDADLQIGLPQNLPGARWLRVADTAEWMESLGNIDDQDVIIERAYGVHERSVVIFVER